jgi:hypothetical protein
MSEAVKSATQPKKAGRRSQKVLIDFTFNHAVKISTVTPNVTANAGVLLLREVDDQLGVTRELAAKMHDPRDPERLRYPMAELLRGTLYADALGHSRQDDADFLAHDPAFKAAVWDKPGDQVADARLASQPTASRLVSLLAREHNLETLREGLSLPLTRHQQANGGDFRVRLGVVDVDGFPIVTYGEQPGAVYNGYYGEKVYSPLAAYFSVNGDFKSRRLGEGFLHAKLRDGNAPPAGDALHFIDRAIHKAQALARTVALRLDAGFAGAEVLNRIDEAGSRFTVRLPDNQALCQLAAPFLVRPQGRPPKEGYELVIELTGYHNPKWNQPYRVILVVVDKPGKNGCRSLFSPDYFFLCTNWPKESMPPQASLGHYRQRGTFEDRIGEWNRLGVNLSLDDFAKNEATLLLSMLAFNLLEILRREAESARDPRPHPPATPKGGSGWDMSRLTNVLLKSGAVLSRGGRRLWFGLAEGISPLWRAVVARIRRWRQLPAASPAALLWRERPFVPPPRHAYLSYTPRF